MHLTPPRGDEWRAEALLCFGGSGWDTREQGDARGSSMSPGQVITPLEGQGSAWEEKVRDLPAWGDII